MANDQEESPSHTPGTPKGEEMRPAGGEPGRENEGTNPAGRPTGEATGRFSTGINPDAENPIDPDSPEMPPP